MYYSFCYLVDKEFIPILNKESCGYAWGTNDAGPNLYMITGSTLDVIKWINCTLY